MGKLGWLVMAVLVLGAGPAGALSTEQVLELKKAGVSEDIIQKLIDNEMHGSGPSRQGRYVVRQAGGGEVIVYQAGGGSPEMPLEMDPAWRQAPGLRGMLGRQPSQDPPAGQASGTPPEPATPHGRYTLLLESQRELAAAKKRAKELSAEGVEARVESVDLGAQGRWYRVLHGHFSGREQAEAQGEKLREVGGIGSYTVLAR
ncbi:MAG: SPOR domain-containing protein [Pseudomonadota bacterium]